MHESSLSRRRLLGGLGTAGTLGLAGCASRLNIGPQLREGPGRFIPRGDRFWGPNKGVTWFSPATVAAHGEALESVDEYYLLNSRHNPGTYGLSYEDVSLVFHDSYADLKVLEGSFTKQEAMDDLDVWAIIERKDEYRGITLWKYSNRWYGFQEGRLIRVRKSLNVDDPRAAIEAVIDTLTGHHPPHLAAQPDFHAIMDQLEPGLGWYYAPVLAEPPMPGVQAFGGTTRFIEADEVATRVVYSFPSARDVTADGLDDVIDRFVYYRMNAPTIAKQDNLLIVDAAATIDELAID